MFFETEADFAAHLRGAMAGHQFAAAEARYDCAEMMRRALRRLVEACERVWVDGYLDDQAEFSAAHTAACEALARCA